MAYTPNPDDATQPTDATIAETAAAEFRALKAKLNGVVLAAGNRNPKRQTILTGLVDSNGVAAYLAASATALGVDFLGGTTAAYLSFANGFSNTGAIDAVAAVSIDLLNYWAGLAVNNTNYLYADYVDAVTNPVAGKTLAPPQYGYVYNKAAQSVLQFAGAAGSTTFLDDFGNTWTAQGSARVQSNNFKFGTGGLGGAGVNNALNGTTDYLKVTSFLPNFDGSWSLRGWFNPSSLPAAGAVAALAALGNATGFGIVFYITNNAGNIKFAYNLSSNGTSADIAVAATGTSTPVVGTWYFIELTYDMVAATYRLYVNGIQESTTASAAKITQTSNLVLGANALGASFFNGYIDEFEFLPYCQHPAGTAYAVPTAAPNIAAAGYASDWFDINAMQMKQVSAASPAAGSNPIFTQKNRLYLGEANTNAVAVTGDSPCAINGIYVSPWATPLPGVSTVISKNHNLGTRLHESQLEVQCITGDQGYGVGTILEPATAPGAYTMPFVPAKNKNSDAYTTAQSGAFKTVHATSGADVALTAANWQYRLRAERSW